MEASTENALITTLGAIFGTVLTVYYTVIRKPQQSTGDALDIKNSATRAIEKTSQIVSHIPFERDDSVPFDSALMFARSSDANIIKLPPRSTVYLGVLGNGAYIPRSGVYLAIVFITGWFIGWTAAIFAAARDIYSNAGRTDFDLVFMSGWLIAAIAAEFVAVYYIFNLILKAFGQRYLVIMPDLVIDMNRIFMKNIEKIYFRKHLKNFRAELDGLVFEYGKNDIKIDGITRVEAEWVRKRLCPIATETA